jgi:predicted ThiF/HesA family dinucleotide-utilizing enzyme
MLALTPCTTETFPLRSSAVISLGCHCTCGIAGGETVPVTAALSNRFEHGGPFIQ